MAFFNKTGLADTFSAKTRKTATVNDTTVTWGGPDNDIEVKIDVTSAMSSPRKQVEMTSTSTSIKGGNNFSGNLNGIKFKKGQPQLPKGTVIKPA